MALLSRHRRSQRFEGVEGRWRVIEHDSRDSLVDKRTLRFVIITCNYLGTWHAISYQSPHLHVHVRGPMCPTLQLPISVVVPLQISKRRTALHKLLVERRAGRKCDSLALPIPMLCGLNRGRKCKAAMCTFCTQVKTKRHHRPEPQPSMDVDAEFSGGQETCPDFDP